MTRIFSIFSLVGFLTTFSLGALAQTPLPSAPSDQTQILKSAEAFARNLFAWGPQFQVKLGPLSPSSSPDFYTLPLEVTVGGQKDSAIFFMSKDGKTFLRGELYDISANPFAENLAHLHLEDNPSRGPDNSNVTLVEFSDFECPHCRELYRTWKELEPQYPQVRVVFKDFPIVHIHPWAMTAAIGARCAYMQSPAAFWRLHDSIFDNQDIISAENVWEKLVQFADAAALNLDTFKACMTSPEARQAIERNVADGQALKISSTPTVFVNGRPLIGGGREELVQYLQYELSAAAPTRSPASVP